MKTIILTTRSDVEERWMVAKPAERCDLSPLNVMAVCNEDESTFYVAKEDVTIVNLGEK